MVKEIAEAARRMAERKVRNCFTMASHDSMPERNGGALAFAEFVTCKITQAVISGVFVRFAQGGVIENLLDKFIDGQTVVEHGHTDVNELRRVFSDDTDAQKFLIGAREDQLQHTSGRSEE